MKKMRRKIHEIDETNDIKYRGPLTYQHLRIIAWLSLALAQIGVILNLIMKVNKDAAASLTTPQLILSLFADLATPLFLIANFAVILCAREGYKKLLIRFGVLSAGMLAAFFLLYEHYIVGLTSALLGVRSDAYVLLEEILHVTRGFLAFNIFLDLFLCTLVMFFLNYQPKKVFVGKKLIIFRLFALIPMIYEGVMVLLKILASTEVIVFSPYAYPFLPTKPPLEFVFFIALALFIKRRERKFIKNGKSREDYDAFLETRTNSFHFSVHAAIIAVICVVIDFALLILIGVIFASQYGSLLDEESAVYVGLTSAVNIGFGLSIPLILAVPILLLFSYNRAPKRPQLNLPVTLGGAGLIAAIYIEGAYRVICEAMVHFNDVIAAAAEI